MRSSSCGSTAATAGRAAYVPALAYRVGDVRGFLRSVRRMVAAPLVMSCLLPVGLAVMPSAVRADSASLPPTGEAQVAPGSASSSGPGQSAVDRATRAQQPPASAATGEALEGRSASSAEAGGPRAPDANLAAAASHGEAPSPLVARGAYLARAGDCVACHTAKNGAPFAGGLPIGSPLGTIYSTNITPDRRTGIGTWSFDDFARLMRHGEVKAGYVVYPAMPYPSYARLTDDDLHALYAYFMTAVPPVSQPNRQNGIAWPLSMRWPLKLWRALFAPKPQPFAPPAGMSAETARGAYLVTGLGHCGSCHTPRGFTLQEKALTNQDGPVYLSGGGAIDGWIAPSLRNEHGGGLANWSADELVQFLKTGKTARTAAFGAMNDVIVDSMQYMNDADLHAIAAYLKSLGPYDGKAPAFAYDAHLAKALYEGQAASPGARLYLDRCAACHSSNGKGYGKAFPALAGNPILQTSNPTSAIHIVLSGGAQPGTRAAPSALTMAPYASLLDDAQVAEVVSFIQTSWGNRGRPATAEQVARMRKNAEPVEPTGFPAPMQRELRRADPGQGSGSYSSGVGAGE